MTKPTPPLLDESEPLLTTSDLARGIPRRGVNCSPGTVARWCARGVIVPGGRRVRLAARRVGGRWMASVFAPAEKTLFAYVEVAGGGTLYDYAAPRLTAHRPPDLRAALPAAPV